MTSQQRGSGKTAPEKRFEALHAAVEGGHTGHSRPRAGVTDCGAYGYRYDEQGRFYAVLLDDAVPRAGFRFVTGTLPLHAEDAT